MITFFSDLDNTLIFSHRKQCVEDKILVEYLNGKEQSYMTVELFQLLLKYKNIFFVPVTTRSIEQYMRIHTLQDVVHNKHALVCNGGVLLVDGMVDKEWLCDSVEISRTQNVEVQRILKRVKEDKKVKKINVLQDFMFYFSCNDVDEYYCLLKQIVNCNDVFLGKDSSKIYVIASIINKGTSVERYIRRFGVGEFFTAGDSEFDVPMLNLDAKAIASAELRDYLNNDKVIYSECKFLFQDINKLINRVIEG